MKKYYWIGLLVIAISMCSCEKDIENELPPIPEPGEPGVEQVYLGVYPTIANVEVVTRGIITNFVDNDKIGMFLTSGDLGGNYQESKDAVNIPAARVAGKWQVDKDIEITTPGVVYAYYPYNNTVVDGTKVPVEVATQTDYLYADKAVVDAKNPIANITMKHALSMVSVRVRKNDYQLTGKLTKVEVMNVQTTGTMDIATGEVAVTGSEVDYVIDKDLLLDDGNLEKIRMIMLPARIADGGKVRFRITVDGKYYTWDVPNSHVWEAGKEYTYTMNLGKVQEELPDLELEVDYWKQYGKDDNMVIGSNEAYYRKVNLQMGSTPYGRTLVKGEAFIFSGMLYTTSADGFKGRIKYTLWQGDKMVEQFPSYYFDIYQGVWFATFFIPCYITSEPGIYRLKMLLQEDGKAEWFHASERYSQESDWIYTVIDDNSVPSIKSMNVEGEEVTGSLIRTVQLNQPFNMEYTMTNRAGITLNGEIKAVWHRTFTGEFNLVQEADGNEWEDEIGRVRVSMTADQKEYKGKISCTITRNRSASYCPPEVHFYYKADGTNEWKFMRSDADSELQRWKGADINNQLLDNINGNAIWCLGGINYQGLTLE